MHCLGKKVRGSGFPPWLQCSLWDGCVVQRASVECRGRTCCARRADGQFVAPLPRDYTWVRRQAARFDVATLVGKAGHIFSLGFICNRWALRRLLDLGLFRRVGVDSKALSQATERLLGAIAEGQLRSPPTTCALDGDFLTYRRPRYLGKATHERALQMLRPWFLSYQKVAQDCTRWACQRCGVGR